MAKLHEEVEVSEYPPCDLCGHEAHYDAATKQGPWGYLCDMHFGQYGLGLGLGRGQKLILREAGK